MNRSGFTLIEVLSASTLSAILAVAVISFIRITNSEIQDGRERTRMQLLHSVVSEQIAISARASYGAARSTEAEGAPVAPTDPAYAGLDEIRFYDEPTGSSSVKSINNFTAAYRISSGRLEEGKGPTPITWKPFVVGEDTVHVVSESSAFRILPGRSGVVWNLKLMRTAGGLTFKSTRDSEFVLCRN